MESRAEFDQDVPPPPPSRRSGDGSADSVRVLKPRRAAPADAVRPTRAEVNLAALRHNLRVVERHAAGARVWPVLKADGYGHGAPAVARTLERAGASGFCVALLEEAVELRDAGIRTPLLVMGGYYGGAYEEVASQRIVPVVYDAGHIEGFARAARALGRHVDVHLKVDTGMARLGVRPEGIEAFAAALRDNPEVRVTGLMTHLASADAAEAAEDSGFTGEQIARFEDATARLARLGIRPALRHVANSAAVLRGHARFDMVRPGIAIFGVSPRAQAGQTTPPARGEGASFTNELRGVMRVRSEVVDLRTLGAGEAVGYGGIFRTTRPTVIATLPLGYADGLSRQLSNRGHVLLRGRRAPIVGAVSMDMSMIDVTDIPGASLRDEVVALGAQEGPLGKDSIGADEVAAHAGTIPWEILTSISRRVPRFYREP
jgi:alanine racemase